MKVPLTRIPVILFAFVVLSATTSHGQVVPPDLFPDDRPQREQPKSIEDTLAKLQIEKSRKEHEELLERGNEASKIIEKIETSFARNANFTPKDLAELDRLEKVVRKIRDDLGGDSDDKAEAEIQREVAADPSPDGAFRYLKETTAKLVTELKRSTRYSISAVAIQASNGVITVARFLRLRK